jgi:4-oxalocrotonate tautomerase
MPVVEVKMWKGMSEESASKIISGITQVFVDLGIPAQAVEVFIQEIPKTHWGLGGKPFSITRPGENPP